MNFAVLLENERLLNHIITDAALVTIIGVAIRQAALTLLMASWFFSFMTCTAEIQLSGAATATS